jgi:HK97 gp10 family phage protein
MTVIVFGLDRVNAFLDSLPVFVLQSADKIMGSSAEMMLQEAQHLVPVRTGRLQRSLKITHEGTCIWSVGSDLGYAGYVEFGTRYMRAQPYLRPAYALTKPRLIDSVAGLIEQLKSEFLL